MDEPPPTRASLILRLRDSADAGAWREFVTLYEPLVYELACRKGLQDADSKRNHPRIRRPRPCLKPSIDAGCSGGRPRRFGVSLRPLPGRRSG